MAIYLGNNDQALKANANGTAMEKKYARELQEVQKLLDRFRTEGNSAIIQFARKVDAKDRVKSMTSKKIKKLPPVALPAAVQVYDEEIGATTIRYSETPPQRAADNKLTWGTKHIVLNENMTIKESQKDLAWYLLYACNLMNKGIYELVDKKAKYEGSFADILVKKDAINALDIKQEELVRHIAQKFVSENVMNTDLKDLVVQIYNWCDANKKWAEVWKEIEKFNSVRVLEKQRVSEIEYDGEPVMMMTCPIGLKAEALREDAKRLGIALTVPPQTKDVLYSLIQHVEKIKELVNE
jgi:hypothetical protein